MKPLMHNFNTEHLSENVRRRMAESLEAAREHQGDGNFNHRRYDIERQVFICESGKNPDTGRDYDPAADFY